MRIILSFSLLPFLYLPGCSPVPGDTGGENLQHGSERSTQVSTWVPLSWKELDSLEVDYYFDESYGDYLGKPIFSAKASQWEGKSVVVEGYWIPVSEIGDSAVSVLSALPYSQCFFCSGAGIETVMQIKPNGKIPRLDADDKVRLRGIFRLNAEDPMSLFYILEDARLE